MKNHNFKDGDIVTDKTFKEVFIFNDKIDGYLARTKPEQLKLSTDKEKEWFNKNRKDQSYKYL